MRILIADDHSLFRSSLRSLLESRDHDVVGEAGTGQEAVELSRAAKPELVLMDLTMPDVNGIEATRALRQELPEIKVVMLTASDDDADLFEALKAGARGYLMKDLHMEEFFELLEGVARDEPALTPQLARKVLSEFAKPKTPDRDWKDPDALTERENEVLELMVQGVTSNRSLAHRMGVSENTIKFHVRNILDKLHLHSRAQAVGFALRNKLVDSPDSETES
jgi:DNA-binding NarL/FixJ family response regulator